MLRFLIYAAENLNYRLFRPVHAELSCLKVENSSAIKKMQYR